MYSAASVLVACTRQRLSKRIMKKPNSDCNSVLPFCVRCTVYGGYYVIPSLESRQHLNIFSSYFGRQL